MNNKVKDRKTTKDKCTSNTAWMHKGKKILPKLDETVTVDNLQRQI